MAINPHSLHWLVVSTPLKNMTVSWDDNSQYMESRKIHVPNHQPMGYVGYIYIYMEILIY